MLPGVITSGKEMQPQLGISSGERGAFLSPRETCETRSVTQDRNVCGYAWQCEAVGMGAGRGG